MAIGAYKCPEVMTANITIIDLAKSKGVNTCPKDQFIFKEKSLEE